MQVGQELVVVENTQTLPSTPTTTYTVQRGDSLWNVANKYNTTVAELKRLNNLTSDILQIGQILIVPTTSTPGITPPETTTYTVQRGDSLWSIANKYNTTVAELRRLNNLTSDILQIGQTLKVPSSNRNQLEKESTYRVKQGDSLWLIAKRYNTTVTDLINYNQLESINLKMNDALKIPDSRINHYTVKQGDTLWSIASANNLSVQELKKLNNLQDNSVTIGQTLIIS